MLSRGLSAAAVRGARACLAPLKRNMVPHNSIKMCPTTVSTSYASPMSSASARYASTLIVAEHDNENVAAGTLSAVTAAKAFGGDITVLVAGHNSQGVADAVAKVDGVTKVLHAQNECYQYGIAENLTKVALSVVNAGEYSHIVAPSSNYGKNIIPRIAAKLDVQAISDVAEIISEDTFTRPMYAGNAVSKVKSNDKLKVMTIRPTSFEKAAAEGGSASVEDAPGAAEGDAGLTTFVSEEKTESDRPDLGTANIVLSGGRGLKNGENFELLYDLADKMGAAVGASRAAVDAGFVPNDMQVGQTGKVVAPQLYMAFGISGAIQHIAGMKDSKTIVAVNKDPEAPIFQIADYGLVDDLFKVIPELKEKV